MKVWNTAITFSLLGSLMGGFAQAVPLAKNVARARGPIVEIPEKKPNVALSEAYAMATRPSPDAMKALVFIDNACRWLTPMTDAWLNANNPQRTERLKA